MARVSLRSQSNYGTALRPPLACGVYKQPPFPSATDTLAKTHTIAAIIKRLFFIVASYREREIPSPHDLI